jgi:fumarylacetoacetase
MTPPPGTLPVTIDHTHDPAMRSWVESANDPSTDFPIQNLPWCVFHHPEHDGPVVGVRVGDSVLDVGPLHDAGLLGDAHHHDHAVCDALEATDLMGLAMLDAIERRRLRHQLQLFLRHDAGGGQQTRRIRAKSLFDAAAVQVLAPITPVPNYTDFYASVFHATNVGSMFRPDNPLLPNYKHVPIGYHGRASSIVPSGTPVRRPLGQLPPAAEGTPPTFGPSASLDYELEVGLIVARGNDLGHPIPIDRAEDFILGLVLVNDWSARDLQRWEYQPLGPFLAKNFATSVSPYLVTIEALAPFRCAAFGRPHGDPAPLPYLASPHNSASGGFDITLEVLLASRRMREQNLPPHRLSLGSFKDMYWTLAQLLTHHASNGCNLQPGDMLASGTVSGPARSSRGCLLELTWNGDAFATPPRPAPGSDRTPITLPTGETRVFLADGDEVILRGWCQRDGFRRIGLGECRGVVEPALPA